MAGFGFSVGDILACGKLCHQMYKACFSDSGDSIASWNYLGRELYALGTALKTLLLDDNIIPPHLHIEDNRDQQAQKEERALEAVRMVVGDFKETLRELEAMLLKYADFRTTGGAKLYWLKVKFSVNSGDLDKFRTRIAMHTRAVNLLLNPLIYQQMKGMQTSQYNIQTSVLDIQTRIDTIDQVLHALLFVAAEQLSSASPRIPSSSRVGPAGYDGGVLRSPNKHLLESSPMNVQTIPNLLSGVGSGAPGRPMIAEEMARSTSHPPKVQNFQSSHLEDSPKIGIRRRTIDNIQPSLSYKTTMSGPDRKKHSFLDHGVHEGVDPKYKEKHILNGGQHSYFTPLSQSPPTTLNFPSPEPQRKASVGSVADSENPIDAALRKQAESNEAQDIPIEHWITAAMHWYFKAESELDEEAEGQEVSPEAYLGLMKSTWIVENVIRQWDSEAELPREIRVNVETLIASIVDKFRKMGSRKMPDIRNLRKQDFEIWHEDIKDILVKPTSPLASHPISRESTIKRPSWGSQVDRPPRKKSASSSSEHSITSDRYPHRTYVAAPEPDRVSHSFESLPRLGEDMDYELDGSDEWSESVFALTSLNRLDSATMGESEPSARHSTVHGGPVGGRAVLESHSQSLPVGIGSFPEYLALGGSPPGSSDMRLATRDGDVRRSPSASTTSTGSSGRRESLGLPRSPISDVRSNTTAIPIPAQRRPLPPISKPTPAWDPISTGSSTNGFDRRSEHSSISEGIDESESVEMIGERLVLDTISVLWASRSVGPFTAGSLKIFWHQSHEYFRLFTTWGGGRSNSQDIPLRSMELVPAYAYEEEPILYLRKVNQRFPVSSNTAGTSPSTRNEISRKGYVYKFDSLKEMLKFQTALTGEDVYQDLIKRVSAVKFKRLTERGGHTYHNARLQLWHEKPPADSLLPDTASGLTGMSQATRFRLSLQWSRLVVYFGGSDCFVTCFVTDDITLKRDGNKLSLVPTKYSARDVLFKSPKSVKALLIGGDHAKGGFRLDKDRMSWNDEHSFEDFSYIQIIFKEILHLNKFETLWNQMMDVRRKNRMRISSLQREIERRTYAPGSGT